MKFTCERDALKDALQVVVGRTKGSAAIPILSHVLIEAKGSTITLTGHDLDSCSQVTLPAEVEEAGASAVPADRLSSLIGGLNKGSQVVLTTDDKLAKVRAGRSAYQFGVMPPQDFPDVLTPKDPVTLTLSGVDVGRLFKTPAPCISTEQSRIYLNGIYLHVRDKHLTACATNGHMLLRVAVDVTPPAFEGVIVPDKSCAEFARIAGDSDATLEISKNLIAIQAGERRFVTKLIDATFPDYERVIPQATSPGMTLESAVFDGALARLLAARDPEKFPAVKLSWSKEVEHLSASLQSDFGRGDEQVECDSAERDAGEVGCNGEYMRGLIDAMGGERIKLFIDDPGSPIRIENPDDAGLVAVCMPCRV